VEVDEAEITKRYKIPGGAYSDYAILRGDPSDGLPGIPVIGDKTAAQMVTRYGSIEKMLEAGLFRNPEHADYLRKALKVVPPVRDLKIKVPRGRRARYPDEPEVVELMGKKYGIANNLERLVKALSA
jgi:5'-3' exonuclease